MLTYIADWNPIDSWSLDLQYYLNACSNPIFSFFPIVNKTMKSKVSYIGKDFL